MSIADHIAGTTSLIISANNLNEQINNWNTTAVGAQVENNVLPVGLGSGAGDGGGDDDNGWEPFYKTDLIKYAQSKGVSPTENNLGEQFEDIFEDYMKTTFPAQTKAMNFRRADKVWTEANGRSSKPDFVSDDFYDTSPLPLIYNKLQRVSEGSGYEVKHDE